MMELILGLAPMAGVTDPPMRSLAYRYGANYACTEMISAMGLMCAKADNPAYQRLLAVEACETNTAAQLFGRDPVLMGEAAAKLTEMGRYSMVDINMGCPAKKVVSSGEGSALLKDPDKAFRIMEAVRDHTSLPVTVKTRLGYDRSTMNALRIGEGAQALGYRWICIHGRTREQQYSGRADWAAIGEIASRLTLPVIANGDVTSPGDAREILRMTGAKGLMIGRGAMGNPQLFREIRGLLENGVPGEAAPPLERLAAAREHARLKAAFEGERVGVMEMRMHLGRYVAGIRGASQMRRELCAVSSLAEVDALLDRMEEALSSGEMN